MKKLIFTGILAATLVAFTGCGEKQAEVPAEETTEVTTDETVDESADVTIDEGYEEPVETEEQVSYDGDKLPIVYFDFDKFDVRADQEGAIGDIGSAIAANSGVAFRIEGNCDEWGTEEYNYALGLKRAKSVQDALVKAGVSVDQITLISYGESNPVCAQSNASCWRQNRRVEVTALQQ
ncbi:MAG: OmpA family protein [Helicobacteraceae bacterium]|jgi:peptidoglycan-associated lipoprotein|nr:OmpA family protein [Helicobacteraceae bacterium]